MEILSCISLLALPLLICRVGFALLCLGRNDRVFSFLELTSGSKERICEVWCPHTALSVLPAAPHTCSPPSILSLLLISLFCYATPASDAHVWLNRFTTIGLRFIVCRWDFIGTGKHVSQNLFLQPVLWKIVCVLLVKVYRNHL